MTQRLLIHIYSRYDLTEDDVDGIDKSITDTYTISVDQYGSLRLTLTKSDPHDNSEDSSISSISNAITDISDIINGAKDTANELVPTQLGSIPLNGLRNFVFPGAKVFTYKSASFSDYQDLICLITYVNPSVTNLRSMGSLAPAPPAPEPASTSSGLKLMHPSSVTNVSSRRSLPPAPPAPKPTSTSSGLKLTHSSDLMQNYIQGEIVSPTGKFEALQTDDGRNLLFAVDASSILHVIEEQRGGRTRTGWEIHDLSTAAVQAGFPGRKDAFVRSFDVGQSALDGTIGLAMAVSSEGSDHLLVSLSNDSTDTSWIGTPTWALYLFDAVAQTPPTSLSIVGIMFAETLSSQQYLVVDIDRSSNSSTSTSAKDIVRYYIDPAKTSGSHWVRRDVPVDIEDGNYQSCVGMIPKGFADGFADSIYTSGTTAGAAQLVYMPVINPFGVGPPNPIRLSPPNGMIPSAIATSRNVDGDKTSDLYGTTDLYAVSESMLYRFATDAQCDGCIASPLVSDDLLHGTSTLLAMTHDAVTMLWGKNGSNQVFYLSCPTAQISIPGAWSAPVPLVTGVERISA